MSIPLRSIIGLLVITGCILNPVSAREYLVVPGSKVLIRNISEKFNDPNINNKQFTIANESELRNAPIFGGMFHGDAPTCTTNPVMEIEGQSGVRLHATYPVIAGFTGGFNNGRIKIIDANNESNSRTLVGGIVFDQNGYTSAVGNTDPSSVRYYCAGAIPPFSSNKFYSPNSAIQGNISVNVSGDMWIYVSKELQPGTRMSLNAINILQGYGLIATIPVTSQGDTLLVIPPPCTISTQSMIQFNTNQPNGNVVLSPIQYQCGDTGITTQLDAYANITAVSPTLSSTELALTFDNGDAAGNVRGYLGENVNVSSATCKDTVNSIKFNVPFSSKLGPAISGSHEIPLVWQLCITGNEGVGEATGSAIIEIAYK